MNQTPNQVNRKLTVFKQGLQERMRKILEINRTKKSLSELPVEVRQEKVESLKSELRIMNKMADRYANLVRYYEHKYLKQENKLELKTVSQYASRFQQ